MAATLITGKHWRYISAKPAARWALRWVYLLLFAAVCMPWLANHKPLYCKIEGKTQWPVWQEWAAGYGLVRLDPGFFRRDWKQQTYQRVIWPLIPYSSSTQDLNNSNFRGPFEKQQVSRVRFRHWLGTDRLGRDVAAGMISGARIAILVGIGSMGIASLLGLLLGGIGGFFGNDGLRLRRSTLVFALMGLLFAGYGAWLARLSLTGWIKTLALFAVILLLFLIIAWGWRRIKPTGRQWTIPADSILMRLIELFNSIPALLVLLALVALIRKPSVVNILIIIGLIRWTGIARYLRAELLRIRSMEYIEAARAIGLTEWRILWRHALPNALPPVLVTIAFGIASAVLLEAALSFLGLGVSAEQVTWGTLLGLARENFSAWWLAAFPGIAIFLTVTSFNVIGQAFSEALDARQQSN